MAYSYSHISYGDTGFFSSLVTDYLAEEEAIQGFYTYSPDDAGLEKAIAGRQSHSVDRETLVNVLQRQYGGLDISPAVAQNIASLAGGHTFTVTTAHQPNLMTGYLYFIYKILHAIKLAGHLSTKHAGKHFVPVFYMGSEDNDLEELGVFSFRGDKYRWDGDGQKGAVGRMDTATLKPLLQRMLTMFGPPGKDSDDLAALVANAYFRHKTVGAATRYLVNALFGRYGLVVIDPDDRALKNAFVPVMEDELLNSVSFDIVTRQTALLEENYKAQAFPRPINLFYLDAQVRERIERQGERWAVLNTGISFSREELLAELHAHPEKFSPNVVLRGLFQATILPDVAFIGGGAEVAYWMQLKTLFAHYNIFFPVVLLRQSVQWIHKEQVRLRLQSGLDIAGIFKPAVQLENEYVASHTDGSWRTDADNERMALIFGDIEARATAIDVTLRPAAAAALTRMRKQLAALEKKMLRAEKRKMEVQLERLRRLKAALFPGGSLQERTENFAAYYLDYGPSFFDTILEGIGPLSGKFLVVEEAAA